MTRRRPAAASRPEPAGQFASFDATELYCPRCGRAMPVRPRLFLVLPEGDRYTYHCAGCGDVLGEKIARPAPVGWSGGGRAA